MRKTLLVMTMVLFTILSFTLSSCGNKPSVEEVASKIQNNEELSQTDYGVMLDYCINAVTSTKKALESGKKTLTLEDFVKKGTNIQTAGNMSLVDFDDDYPNYTLFWKALLGTDGTSENKAKAKKLFAELQDLNTYVTQRYLNGLLQKGN